MSRIYLAHSAYERERGNFIIKELEEMGFEVYNPFLKEGASVHQKAFWTDAKEVVWNEDPSMESCYWIIFNDLDGVYDSDILVCIYPEEYVTYGITCEMMFWLVLTDRK